MKFGARGRRTERIAKTQKGGSVLPPPALLVSPRVRFLLVPRLQRKCLGLAPLLPLPRPLLLPSVLLDFCSTWGSAGPLVRSLHRLRCRWSIYIACVSRFIPLSLSLPLSRCLLHPSPSRSPLPRSSLLRSRPRPSPRPRRFFAIAVRACRALLALLLLLSLPWTRERAYERYRP